MEIIPCLIRLFGLSCDLVILPRLLRPFGFVVRFLSSRIFTLSSNLHPSSSAPPFRSALCPPSLLRRFTLSFDFHPIARSVCRSVSIFLLLLLFALSYDLHHLVFHSIFRSSSPSFCCALLVWHWIFFIPLCLLRVFALTFDLLDPGSCGLPFFVFVRS